MNDLVLAVDTTHEFGSIALTSGEHLIAEREIHAPSGFGQVLYGEIESLLRDNSVRLQDCALFAAAAGPGSFTGVRIALTCVKGFGEVLQRPVIGISNLEALAEFGTEVRRAAIADARKGEVYAAVYGPEPIAETVLPLDQLLGQLPPDTELISIDFDKLQVSGAFRCITAPRGQATAMARLAWRKWRAGAASDAALVDANYIRRPEAERLYRPPV